jgi:hypothetical protein
MVFFKQKQMHYLRNKINLLSQYLSFKKKEGNSTAVSSKITLKKEGKTAIMLIFNFFALL